MTKRLLLLEDGTIFEGQAFGADVDVTGELVFVLGQTGYQEVVTDLAHTGQIVVFSQPLVGASGMSREGHQSIQPACKGVVVGDWLEDSSHPGSQLGLGEFLRSKGIPGIAGVDTRALVRKLTQSGPMRATLALEGDELGHLQDQLRATVLQKEHVKQVSTRNPYPAPASGWNLVLVDLGVKHGLLRELAQQGYNVTVVPYQTSADEILALFPDAVLFSSGPGSPEVLPETLETARNLAGQLPLFGLGLGHHVLAQALGAQLDEGAAGGSLLSQGIREIATGRLAFCAQQTQRLVSREALSPRFLVTHEAVLDESIQGLRHRDLPLLSVQFLLEGQAGIADPFGIYDDMQEILTAFYEKER